jgi:hypothetical protein
METIPSHIREGCELVLRIERLQDRTFGGMLHTEEETAAVGLLQICDGLSFKVPPSSLAMFS